MELIQRPASSRNHIRIVPYDRRISGLPPPDEIHRSAFEVQTQENAFEVVATGSIEEGELKGEGLELVGEQHAAYEEGVDEGAGVEYGCGFVVDLLADLQQAGVDRVVCRWGVVDPCIDVQIVEGRWVEPLGAFERVDDVGS